LYFASQRAGHDCDELAGLGPALNEPWPQAAAKDQAPGGEQPEPEPFRFPGGETKESAALEYASWPAILCN
jgi:hypothetical protein